MFVVLVGTMVISLNPNVSPMLMLAPSNVALTLSTNRLLDATFSISYSYFCVCVIYQILQSHPAFLQSLPHSL